MKKFIKLDDSIKNVEIGDKPYPVFVDHEHSIEKIAGEVSLNKTSPNEVEISKIKFKSDELKKEFETNRIQIGTSIQVLERSEDGNTITNCKLISVSIIPKQ